MRDAIARGPSILSDDGQTRSGNLDVDDNEKSARDVTRGAVAWLHYSLRVTH